MTKYSYKNELKYCEMLNRVLPSDIRAISWMPLETSDISARFDCVERTYRYYFPRGCLDIDAMKIGTSYLVGQHDYRNLCKMDVANGVVVFEREIREAAIYLVNEDFCGGGSGEEDTTDHSYDMFYLEITGTAFLWHQIRCMVAVLFLIGQKNEDPNIILELLDVERNPWFVFFM